MELVAKSTSMRTQMSATRCNRMAAALEARIATRAMPNGLESDGFASCATSCPAIQTISRASFHRGSSYHFPRTNVQHSSNMQTMKASGGKVFGSMCFADSGVRAYGERSGLVGEHRVQRQDAHEHQQQQEVRVRHHIADELDDRRLDQAVCERHAKHDPQRREQEHNQKEQSDLPAARPLDAACER